MSLIQGKTVHWLGEDSVSGAVEYSASQEILGKIKFYRALEKTT